MTSMRQVFIYFFNFSSLLLPFGIFSHYPIFDSNNWLNEDDYRIMDKVFKEKLVD